MKKIKLCIMAATLCLIFGCGKQEKTANKTIQETTTASIAAGSTTEQTTSTVKKTVEATESSTPASNDSSSFQSDFKTASINELKGMLDELVKKIFGEGTKTRLRPSYFPFTEPSVEVDCSCFECGGKGCKLCKGTGWIEILGAGVVNNKVLENCGIDPNEYSGFAFGIGIERIAMLKYGINNIKLLFESDLRVLKQIND